MGKGAKAEQPRLFESTVNGIKVDRLNPHSDLELTPRQINKILVEFGADSLKIFELVKTMPLESALKQVREGVKSGQGGKQ